MTKLSRLGLTATVLTLGVGIGVVAGPLTPPAGPVAPTYKTLNEVEPRIAISATNTPGDADSVYRISQPGSYYLTGSVAGAPGKAGIEIAASNVTLDLCGYAIAGAAGALTGVRAPGLVTGVSVVNGEVSGWPGNGLDLTAVRASRVRDVRSWGNSNWGLMAGENAVVTGCTVYQNDGVGISTGTGAAVSGCVARDNTGNGISVGAGSSVAGCSAVGNLNGIVGSRALITECSVELSVQDGIVALNDSTISRCASHANTGVGIRASTNGSITQCSASENGDDGIQCNSDGLVESCTATLNGSDGISVASRVTVRGCVCTRNNNAAGAGIRLNAGECVLEGNSCRDNFVGIDATGSTGRIEGNTCTGNGIGISLHSAGNFVARNTVGANTTNWSSVAGNVMLVVQMSPAGIVLGDTGGVSPGSTNPNANYTY